MAKSSAKKNAKNSKPRTAAPKRMSFVAAASAPEGAAPAGAAPASDEATIDAGYADTLKGLFNQFFLNSNPAQSMDTAAQHFTNGLQLLRQVRDRAKQIVGQAATA